MNACKTIFLKAKTTLLNAQYVKDKGLFVLPRKQQYFHKCMYHLPYSFIYNMVFKLYTYS